jgi:hypothetical protein
MVKYTTEQHTFFAETLLLKKKSYKWCVHKFQWHYPEAMQPSKYYVLKLFNKWQETGSIADKKKLFPQQALAEQRLVDVGRKQK